MAERIYSKQEIDQFNRTKKAVSGITYTDSEGNKFTGTSEGTLSLLQKATSTPYTASRGSGISSSTVGGALDELGERVSSIEGDYVTEEELAIQIKRAKCFAIAMSTRL